MNFIKHHETAILKVILGITIAGFVAAIQWDVMAKAVGIL